MYEVNEARLARARMEAVGRSIRRYRGDSTQAELGLKLGLSQGSISSWEKGTVDLTCEQIARAESVLGLRDGTLFIEAGFVTESLLGEGAVSTLALRKLESALSDLQNHACGAVTPDRHEAAAATPPSGD